jgi:cyclin B
MYLQNHIDVTEDMRCIVIDWIIDVHRKFNMRMETFFIAISMMDRFLERNRISKEIFQLVATSCLFAAAKYEEIYPPGLEDFVYICADAYTKEDVVNMEGLILAELQFSLVFTSSQNLIGHYAVQSNSS